MTLRKRVIGLEKAADQSDQPERTVRQVVLDGTVEENDRRRAEVLATLQSHEDVIFREIVPRVGETPEEYRAARGMRPLDPGGEGNG